MSRPWALGASGRSGCWGLGTGFGRVRIRRQAEPGRESGPKSRRVSVQNVADVMVKNRSSEMVGNGSPRRLCGRGDAGYADRVQSPISLTERYKRMAKSLDAEMAAIEAEERRLAERRQAHQARVRETAIGTVEKAGLLKLPLDRLERIMAAVKKLGVDEVEKRLQGGI